MRGVYVVSTYFKRQDVERSREYRLLVSTSLTRADLGVIRSARRFAASTPSPSPS
jgi:hypothetical protein